MKLDLVVLLTALGISGCATATPSSSTVPPAVVAPAAMKWTRAYTMSEFEAAIRQQDAAALAAGPSTYFVRTLPTISRWNELRTQYPAMREVWAYEPADADVVLPSGASERRIGNGYAFVDPIRGVVVLHDATSIMAARTL